MPDQIIVDTSVIIALRKIQIIDILPDIYGGVLIPTAVSKEFGDQLPDRFQVISIQSSITRLLCEDLNLGKGEAEVIALGIEKNLRVAIDDLKARKIAMKLELKVTGTIGMLLKSYHLSLIEDPIQKLRDLKKSGFHVSENLINNIKNFIQSK